MSGEDQLRAVLDFVETAALVLESGADDTRIVLYNRFAKSLFGPPAESGAFHIWEQACGFYQANAQSKRPANACAVGDLPWNRANRGELVERKPYFLRNERHRSGLWILADARAEREGETTRILVSIRDISARRRAEQAMRAARRLTRSLFDDSQVPVVRSTVDGRILACNKAFVRMLGYETAEEVRMRRAPELHVPGSREQMIAELTKNGALSEYPIEFRRKDGSRGWAVGSVQMVEPAPDEFEWSIISTMTDVTAHRRAEVARIQSEKRFAEFMRYLPGVAFIKDRYGRYLFFSESSLQTLSLEPGSVVGKTDDEIWPPAVAEQFRRNDQEVISHGKAIHVKEDIPLAGRVHRWAVFKFPIPNESGELTLVGGVGVDETDRWNLEMRLQEAEKMEAIGRLAGGVAHDFNNVLTVISGYAQMMQDAIAREVPVENLGVYVDEILGASGRAANLTDQLLAFGRKKAVRPSRLDLNVQVAETESMLRRVIGEHIDLHLEAAERPCFVCADPGQMEQVVMNLVVNARDAMPRGGRLKVRVVPAAGDELPVGLEGSGFVLLEVQDTGTGIDPAIRPHIFEPFFTSKPKGRGTGLGLSTVYGIVKQTGGEIAVKTESGVGTTFQLFLPACGEEDGAPRRAPEPVAKAPRGDETILLVEDDNTVRSLVKAMLEKYGYRTIVAENGKEALRLFRERGAEVHLLLTDVVMPQMSGRELAVAIGRIAPHLKVLYMSGYTPDEIATQGLVSSTPLLLHKPFSADMLARRVREVLDANAQAS